MNKNALKIVSFFKNNKIGKVILYVITVILSILFLVAGNKIATKDLSAFNTEDSDQTIVVAEIDTIKNRVAEEYSLDGINTLENVDITFEATIIEGEQEGKPVNGLQSINSLYGTVMPEAEEGDKVLLLKNDFQEETDWQLIEFVKTDKLLVFGILFVIALLLFGRLKGFNTLLSLVFTCAAVFYGFHSFNTFW